MSSFFYSFLKTLGPIFLKSFSCEFSGEFNHSFTGRSESYKRCGTVGSKHLPYCPFLDSCVVENCILADEPLAKTLIKHNICGKLLSSLDLSTTFDEKLEAT